MNDEHRKARLRHLISTDYGRQADFVRATTTGKSRLSQMLSKTEPFGEEAARRLAIELGLPENWFNLSLPTPKEGRQAALEQPVPAPGTPVYKTSLRSIPVVGRGSGGLMPERIWTDGDHPVGATDTGAELASNDPEAFLVEVVGQSMFPKYENKNFALVEPNMPVELEDVVLVRLCSGETMIKRLISRKNGSFTFSSFNDTVLHVYEEDEVSWIYYCAHEVPRKRIKTRY